nr:diamine acetyltransferase 2-like [Zootoca vivipara]
MAAPAAVDQDPAAPAVSIRPSRAEDCAEIMRMIRELAEFEKMPDQVANSDQGRGIGKKLMSAIAQIGLEKGCTQMKLSALDWNQKAIDLYLGNGAVDLTAAEGWHVFRFEEDAMRQLAAGGASK